MSVLEIKQRAGLVPETVGDAAPPPLPPDEQPQPGDKRGKRQADEAAAAMRDAGELWHDEDGEPWMTFTHNDHREHWPLRSKAIRSLMSLTYFQETGKTLSSQARQDALAQLEGSALFEGATFPVFTRIAKVEDAIWLDLGDDTWGAIKISAAGWCIVNKPPVRFRRRRGMRALPAPIVGSDRRSTLVRQRRHR